LEIFALEKKFASCQSVNPGGGQNRCTMYVCPYSVVGLFNVLLIRNSHFYVIKNEA